MTTFSANDRSTWGEVMTAEEVAAIFRRATGGLKKDCQRRRFIPAPFRSHPYAWRKTDVLAFLDAPRTHLRKVG